MNARQERTLEDIRELLADIRDELRNVRRTPGADNRQPLRRSGLNDLVTADVPAVARLEHDRREAERANGWAPDSELSYRDQYERLERQVREYDRLVDAANAAPDDPRPSSRLPWNQNERVRPIAAEDQIRGKRRSEERAQYDETAGDRPTARRYDPIP